MRVKNAKIKITIPIPIDKSDSNGFVYTEEAVENAVNNLHKNIPIIYYRDSKSADGIVIGKTTGNSHIVAWDFENQVCNMTVDGIAFYSGAEIVVTEMKDGKITDFRFIGIGLSR